MELVGAYSATHGTAAAAVIVPPIRGFPGAQFNIENNGDEGQDIHETAVVRGGIPPLQRGDNCRIGVLKSPLYTEVLGSALQLQQRRQSLPSRGAFSQLLTPARVGTRERSAPSNKEKSQTRNIPEGNSPTAAAEEEYDTSLRLSASPHASANPPCHATSVERMSPYCASFSNTSRGTEGLAATGLSNVNVTALSSNSFRRLHPTTLPKGFSAYVEEGRRRRVQMQERAGAEQAGEGRFCRPSVSRRARMLRRRNELLSLQEGTVERPKGPQSVAFNIDNLPRSHVEASEATSASVFRRWVQQRVAAHPAKIQCASRDGSVERSLMMKAVDKAIAERVAKMEEVEVLHHNTVQPDSADCEGSRQYELGSTDVVALRKGKRGSRSQDRSDGSRDFPTERVVNCGQREQTSFDLLRVPPQIHIPLEKSELRDVTDETGIAEAVAATTLTKRSASGGITTKTKPNVVPSKPQEDSIAQQVAPQPLQHNGKKQHSLTSVAATLPGHRVDPLDIPSGAFSKRSALKAKKKQQQNVPSMDVSAAHAKGLGASLKNKEGVLVTPLKVRWNAESQSPPPRMPRRDIPVHAAQPQHCTDGSLCESGVVVVGRNEDEEGSHFDIQAEVDALESLLAHWRQLERDCMGPRDW